MFGSWVGTAGAVDPPASPRSSTASIAAQLSSTNNQLRYLSPSPYTGSGSPARALRMHTGDQLSGYWYAAAVRGTADQRVGAVGALSQARADPPRLRGGARRGVVDRGVSVNEPSSIDPTPRRWTPGACRMPASRALHENEPAEHVRGDDSPGEVIELIDADSAAKLTTASHPLIAEATASRSEMSPSTRASRFGRAARRGLAAAHVGQLVQRHHRIVGVGGQPVADVVRADEPGPARDEQPHAAASLRAVRRSRR